MNFQPEIGCGRSTHFNRRTLLQASSVAGLSWLTPVAESLARAGEQSPKDDRPKSVIVLWLQGGPSQLETFDPHPGTKYGGDTVARKTNVPGVEIASGFEQLADQMDSIALVRSVTSKEGDHERATYNAKTGFRPDPTLIHPSLGAVACYKLEDNVEIPRHISILSGQWPARGGYLGDQFDAFQIDDPARKIPDIKPQVSNARFTQRKDDLFDIVEKEFSRGRINKIQRNKEFRDLSTEAALRMMSSEQLKAFDIKNEPESLQKEFGDTPFGRGCLAAVRLVEVGVRCVEVTLNGFDSHADNHEAQTTRVATLDPAYASLIRELKNRKLLDNTIVLCGGEFGRTPRINGLGGRDHWPHGFSVALAGGGIKGGCVVGETAAEPKLDEKNRLADIKDPRNIEDIHATLFKLLGIDFEEELETPIGRPMAINKGNVIQELIA